MKIYSSTYLQALLYLFQKITVKRGTDITIQGQHGSAILIMQEGVCALTENIIIGKNNQRI